MAFHIGAIQRSSLIDYPGKISANIFTIGCNFKCRYCHNPELVDPRLFPDTIVVEEVLQFLETRKGKLDAVVITGGEPTLQNGLIEFMTLIKAMGYLIKLDTNGSRPEVIKESITKGIVDYIAMDIKAPLDKYEKIAMAEIDTKDILQSVHLIMDSHLEYEFRTTLLRSLLTPEDILAIGKLTKGARRYVLQKFVSTKALDRAVLTEQSFFDDEISDLRKKFLSFVDDCIVR